MKKELIKQDYYDNGTIPDIRTPSVKPAQKDIVGPTINSYGNEQNYTINNEEVKIHRIFTKSVDFFNKNYADDYSFNDQNNSKVVRKGHSRMSTIGKRVPKFKQHDTLSNLSGEDEWNEIEKYNSMIDKYDQQIKVIETKNSQQMLQESLKKQIQEQKQFKNQQLMENKRLDEIMLDRAKRENLVAERQRLQQRNKQMDRKEMVDKQLQAQLMQHRLYAEEK